MTVTGSSRQTTAKIAHVAAWILLGLGILVVALNPGVPSLGYALLWLATLAVARAISLIVAWSTFAIDLSLIFVCVLGLEFGGLILVPSLCAFAVADWLSP